MEWTDKEEKLLELDLVRVRELDRNFESMRPKLREWAVRPVRGQMPLFGSIVLK